MCSAAAPASTRCPATSGWSVSPARWTRRATRRGHAGADPGAGRTQERADQGGIRGAEGRPAAPGRGADPVDRRVRLLRASASKTSRRRRKKPFDEVKEQVAADWTRDAQRRAQEQAAAKLLAAVKGGQTLADAATVAGVTVRRTPLVTRGASMEGVPQQLAAAAVRPEAGRAHHGGNAGAGSSWPCLRRSSRPDPKADPAGYAQVRQAIGRSIGTDLASVFADALRTAPQPQINQPVVDNCQRPRSA